MAFNFDYKYLDSGYTRPPVLEKKVLTYSTSFGSEKEFYKNCLQYLAAPSEHLCFNVLSDHCTVIDTISCLAADYNNYGFSRRFPRLCQEWPKISILFYNI